jgi:hypothetical protein
MNTSNTVFHVFSFLFSLSRSQLPRGLWRRSVAARLLNLRVRIPPGAWMFVCCGCCVLLGRGLCYELITRLVESYRLWCVVVFDRVTSRMRRPWLTFGYNATEKKTVFTKLSCGQFWAPLLKIMVKHEQNTKAKGYRCSKIQQMNLQQTVKYFEIDPAHVSTISQVKILRSTLAEHRAAVGKSFCNN